MASRLRSRSNGVEPGAEAPAKRGFHQATGAGADALERGKASQQRAPDPRPYRGWRRALSHHGPEEAHHCVHLRLGSRTLALCARCLAVYPTVLLVVALEARVGRWGHPWRWFVATALVAPAVIDWSRARLFAARGSTAGRLITGALAGLGLGLGFSDYLQGAEARWFWILLGVLGILVLWVWTKRSPPAAPAG